MQRIKEIKRILQLNNSTGVICIGPKEAGKLLQLTNLHNRKLSSHHVTFLKNQMVNGFFRLSNDAITFDDDGILTNGQHRLTALALCGENIGKLEFMVGIGVSQFMGMDTGKTRSVQDNYILFSDDASKISDPKYSICINVAKDTCLWCNGVASRSKVSQEEYRHIISFLEKDLIACCDAGLFEKVKKITHIPVMSAFLLAYLNGVEIATLQHIHEVLKSGISTSELDKPIIALRDKLMTIRGGGGALAQERLEYTMDCINKIENKSSAKQLRLSGIRYTFPNIPYVGNNWKKQNRR